MKKINAILAFLIIVAFSIGIYVLYTQMLDKPIEVGNTGTENKETLDENNTNDSNVHREVKLTTEQDFSIEEEVLKKQIKNKKYLEASYMALEYSKVNNEELSNILKSYIDDNSRMKPEEVAKLIDLHEKTFLNRYLKIFVMAPDSDLYNIQNEARRIFYQMKVSFDTLNKFGQIPHSSPVVPTEGEQTTTTTTTFSREEEPEPNYDVANLQLGLSELEKAQSLVNQALDKIGKEDVTIEVQWLKAQLTQEDILQALDNTNTISPNEEIDSSTKKLEPNSIPNND